MPLACRQTAVIGHSEEQSDSLGSLRVPSDRVQRKVEEEKVGVYFVLPDSQLSQGVTSEHLIIGHHMVHSYLSWSAIPVVGGAGKTGIWSSSSQLGGHYPLRRLNNIFTGAAYHIFTL